jgi:DNA modification methylase
MAQGSVTSSGVFFAEPGIELYLGDALEVLSGFPKDHAAACVTSPPYLDARPEYPSPNSEGFLLIFSQLRRVVSGAMLLNVGRLWRGGREYRWWEHLLDLAEAAGWPLTDTRVWIKPNANPIQGEILTNAHEYIFLLGDGFDPDAIRTPYSPESIARFRRRFVANAGVKNYVRPDHRPERAGEANENGARPKSYIEVHTGKEKGNKHPAPMPLELAESMVLLSGGDVILDPFAGSGTTLIAARKYGLQAIGIELDESYATMAAERLRGQPLEQERLPGVEQRSF